MKKYFVLLIVPFIFSCNNNTKSVSISIISNTLQIDPYLVPADKDYYYAKISLKNNSPKFRIPEKLTEVKINEKIIEENKYTYSPNDGIFKIGYNLIDGQIKITAESVEYYSVSINSKSLSISSDYVIKGNDCNIKINISNPTYSKSLPNELNDLIINSKSIDRSLYTYKNGNLSIPSSIINGDIIIKAEVYDKKDHGYEIIFETDNYSSVDIYETNDFTKEPKKGSIAFSYSGDTGELIKDGKGEVNYRINVKEGYDIDYIWVKGLYDNNKLQESDLSEFIYKINDIRGDIVVKIVTKTASIKDLCYQYNLELNSFNFSWSQREKGNIDYIQVTMKDSSNKVIDSKKIYDKKYIYTNNNIDKDLTYYFYFTPYYKNGKSGSTISYSKMINEDDKKSTFPRVEINTENNLELTNYVLNDLDTESLSYYVKSNIKIYNQNNLVYDTSNKTDYDGAKVKIRGNTSATKFNKKPYKIKLNKEKEEDLLKWFYQEESEINYKHKEWVLLPPNSNRNYFASETNSIITKTVVGFETARLLDFDWKPRYQFVQLYLNNDYKGLYILSEVTSKGKGKEDKQSRYKIDDSGYIIEKDIYSDSEDLTIPSSLNPLLFTMGYSFKYPDTDDINTESQEYKNIKNDVIKLEKLLTNKEFSELRNFIDYESFAKWLVGRELIVDNDPYGGNMFIYRKNLDESSKIKMGTIWDFDNSMTNNEKHSLIRSLNFFYYPYLLKDKVFEETEKNILLNLKNNNYIKNITEALDQKIIDSTFDPLLNKEKIRWNFSSLVKVEAQKKDAINFLSTQLNWLLK